MNDIIKWSMKVLLQGIVWVFVLSISIGGRPLYDHAYSTFVDNALVRTVDEELAALWTKVSKTASVTFSDSSKKTEEAL